MTSTGANDRFRLELLEARLLLNGDISLAAGIGGSGDASNSPFNHPALGSVSSLVMDLGTVQSTPAPSSADDLFSSLEVQPLSGASASDSTSDVGTDFGSDFAPDEGRKESAPKTESATSTGAEGATGTTSGTGAEGSHSGDSDLTTDGAGTGANATLESDDLQLQLASESSGDPDAPTTQWTGTNFDLGAEASALTAMTALLTETLRAANGPPGALSFSIPSGVAQVILRRDGNDLNILDGDSLELLVSFKDFALAEKLSILGEPSKDDTLVLDLSGGEIPIALEYDGGDAGFDVLEIRGSENEEAIYTAAGPDSGSVQIGNTRLAYRGLEPIVDTTSSANIVITGTAGDDILVLEENPGNPAQLRIRALNGSLESVAFNHPTASLTINLGGGNDTLTVQLFDSVLGAALIIDGQAGVDTITVPATGVVTTRAFGGANPATDPSTGNSGNVTWSAETITVAAGG